MKIYKTLSYNGRHGAIATSISASRPPRRRAGRVLTAIRSFNIHQTRAQSTFTSPLS
jgi:hypothetical protein